MTVRLLLERAVGIRDCVGKKPGTIHDGAFLSGNGMVVKLLMEKGGKIHARGCEVER